MQGKANDLGEPGFLRTIPSRHWPKKNQTWCTLNWASWDGNMTNWKLMHDPNINVESLGKHLNTLLDAMPQQHPILLKNYSTYVTPPGPGCSFGATSYEDVFVTKDQNWVSRGLGFTSGSGEVFFYVLLLVTNSLCTSFSPFCKMEIILSTSQVYSSAEFINIL